MCNTLGSFPSIRERERERERERKNSKCLYSTYYIPGIVLTVHVNLNLPTIYEADAIIPILHLEKESWKGKVFFKVFSAYQCQGHNLMPAQLAAQPCSCALC
jgi:hypothetical protein